MKYLYLETYKDFKCIGSECPFTCCGGGWRISIEPETAAYYESVGGKFGERLRNNITIKEGTSFFKLKGNGDCPFLNDNKLCDIYINLGEERLCQTCTNYPRYSFLSGDIVFSGVSISCPEVARFFLTNKTSLQIDFAESEEMQKNEANVDWSAFNQSIHAFTASIAIAQNREYTVLERVAVLTLFTFQLQSLIDEKRSVNGLIELFGNTSYFDEILSQTGIYQKDLKSKIDFCVEVMRYFREGRSFDHYIPELTDLIRHYKEGDLDISADKFLVAFSYFDNDEEQIWQEQLLVYVLFRYFMQGFSKDDYYDKFMIGLILVYWLCVTIMVLYYQQLGKMPELDKMVLIISHVSRLIEHDERFKKETLEYFRKEGMTDPFFILKLIS